MDADRSPDLLVSDDERERAAAALREGLGQGRLTLDEFTERVATAYSARTRGELETLTRDLPAPEAAPPATVRRRRATRWSVALMSGISRRSRWRIEDRTTAVAVMGGVELDLRSAELPADGADIVAVAVMGGIEIVVPEGVDVDVTGLSFLGGREVRVRDEPRLPGSPLLRVHAYALMGGIDVRSKPPGRQRR